MQSILSTKPGVGRIVLRSIGSYTVLSELVSSYPLKLLSPRTAHPNVAIVYVLTYGGGLVAGDHVSLHADVLDGAILVLLTQGSTKVFKTRPGSRSARPSYSDPAVNGINATSQHMDVHVASGGALFLLPDPVACFRAASYAQRQTFRLAHDASVVLLDWITSGRVALGEDWSFARYHSLNEIIVDGVRVARDALLLEDHTRTYSDSSGLLPKRTLANRLAPYSCYATVLMYGALTDCTRRFLHAEFEKTTVFKCARPPDLVWSVTAVCEGRGCVLRVAATETEAVREWLRECLGSLKSVIGEDVYRIALG